MLTRRELQGIDRGVLICALLLLGIGLAALYSASFQKLLATGTSYLNRQLTWVILGLGLAVLLALVDYHRWLDWAYFLYGLNGVMLALVLEMGVVRGGAQRWLSIGGLTVQPSEFAKLTTILALARFLGSQPPGERGQVRTLLGAAALLAIPMSLILKEPNLGTAILFLPVGLAMLLVWGVSLRGLGALIGAGALLAPLGWWFLKDYQRSRLLVFLNPNLDPLGAGYTVIQSKIAIGSGGLWGKGWLAGTQNQLNFLPERHTDFIFSVVGEEWGVLGTTVCLALFALLFHRALTVATQTRDLSGRLLVVGLVTLLAAHTVVNTGMALGLAPVVGLPLPFMSYGGSWMMACLVAVGMILSVAARRPVF